MWWGEGGFICRTCISYLHVIAATPTLLILISRTIMAAAGTRGIDLTFYIEMTIDFKKLNENSHAFVVSDCGSHLNVALLCTELKWLNIYSDANLRVWEELLRFCEETSLLLGKGGKVSNHSDGGHTHRLHGLTYPEVRKQFVTLDRDNSLWLMMEISIVERDRYDYWVSSLPCRPGRRRSWRSDGCIAFTRSLQFVRARSWTGKQITDQELRWN